VIWAFYDDKGKNPTLLHLSLGGDGSLTACGWEPRRSWMEFNPSTSVPRAELPPMCARCKEKYLKLVRSYERTQEEK
jgi:hypothetical protein